MDEIILGITIVTDNRVATSIYGVSLSLLHDSGQQLFADHGGYRSLADAWIGITMVDQLVAPNKWTLDTLRRLAPAIPAHLLDTAIDLQVLSRKMEPQYPSYSLEATATRLGHRRAGYKGSPVWTEAAMDAVRQDGLICLDLYHHLLNMLAAA